MENITIQYFSLEGDDLDKLMKGSFDVVNIILYYNCIIILELRWSSIRYFWFFKLLLKIKWNMGNLK